jgi:uncharacterized protein (UPF0332 family)
VTWKPFARVLMRKSERALKSARLALNAGDNDSAVNRSYHAMFDIARAALLKATVAEDKLPRTHNGVSEAFWLHAVQSGLIDRELAAELSRTESLRIKADYTDIEIEPLTATAVVEQPDIFVQTVERVFALEELSLAGLAGHDSIDRGDKVSEPSIAAEQNQMKYPRPEPISLEETRRQARENWRKYKQQQIEGTKGIGHGQAMIATPK